MTDPRETHFTGAEGECENSQAKRSDPDDTSERTAKLPDTKGATVPAQGAHRNLSGIDGGGKTLSFCLFLLFRDLLGERADKLNTEKI